MLVSRWDTLWGWGWLSDVTGQGRTALLFAGVEKVFKQSIMVAFFDAFKINVLQLAGDSSVHYENGRCEVFRRSNVLDIELLWSCPNCEKAWEEWTESSADKTV